MTAEAAEAVQSVTLMAGNRKMLAAAAAKGADAAAAATAATAADCIGCGKGKGYRPYYGKVRALLA